MTPPTVLNELKARGVRVELRPNGNLYIAPRDRLTPELLEAVRQHKGEILAALTASGNADPLCEEESILLPPSLAAVADAIASAPRSPFLNDLVLSRAASCFVAAERASQGAPPYLRAEIRTVTADAMTAAAKEIRRSNYRAAYDAFDKLGGKLREMRAQ